MSKDDDGSDAQVRATYTALRTIESPAQALDARIRAAAVAAIAVPRAEEKLRQLGTRPADNAPSQPTPSGA